MWVVKLGGGLDGDPVLLQWLNELTAVGGGRVVLVPGGGRFMDPVRQVQRHWPVEEVDAHNMAVLALAQSAALMHGLCPRLGLAHDEAQIGRILRRGQVPVWMPLNALREAPDELTAASPASDSLAAWLSGRLNAERLVLVKPCRLHAGVSLQACADQGIVDAHLPHFARTTACPVELVHKDDVAMLCAQLLRGETLGQRH